MPPELIDDQSLPIWYIASPGGTKEGPLSAAMVRARFEAGTFHRDHLAWKDGMPGWLPANQVDGLLPTLPKTVVPPETSSASSPTSPLAAHPHFAAVDAPVDRILARIATPGFFRNIGRASAVLAILFALASVALVFFQVYLFNRILLLALIWLVGEGTAAILESLTALAKVETSEANGNGPKS